MTGAQLTFKKVKVSDKGQISIPIDVQREIGINKGDELLLIRKGQKIILEKPDKISEQLEAEFADFEGVTQESLRKIWLTKKEDVWNKYLKAAK